MAPPPPERGLCLARLGNRGTPKALSPSPAGSPHSLRVMGGGCRGVVPTLYPLVSSLTVGAVSVFCPFCAFSFSCPHLGGVVRWSRGTPAPQAPPVLPPADPTGTLCSPPPRSTFSHLNHPLPRPGTARFSSERPWEPLTPPAQQQLVSSQKFSPNPSKPTPQMPPPTLPWCQDPHFALRNHPKAP